MAGSLGMVLVVALLAPGQESSGGQRQAEDAGPGVERQAENAPGAEGSAEGEPAMGAEVEEAIAPVDAVSANLEALRALQGVLAEEAAARDLETQAKLGELELQVLEGRKPSWVLVLIFILLGLTSLVMFLLVRWSTRWLAAQHGELRRQRLQVQEVEEMVRELPANLPKPTLDVAQLAEQLRGELELPSTAPVEPEVATPPAPFYHDEQWLPRAVEGPRRYLEYLSGIRQTIGEVHEELATAEDPGEALALTSWMLSRFYRGQGHRSEDRWRQVLKVAEESGYVCDQVLTERLQRAKTEGEAARTLHRALYREVLEQSISDHLILIEEMRHLAHFCGQEASRAACRAVGQRIDPMVEDFLTETRRLAGYTPNYVSLFSGITDEVARFLRNNASEWLPWVYRHLKLPRRQVLCVLAYGLRRERGWENEETQVILS